MSYAPDGPHPPERCQKRSADDGSADVRAKVRRRMAAEGNDDELLVVEEYRCFLDHVRGNPSVDHTEGQCLVEEALVPEVKSKCDMAGALLIAEGQDLADGCSRKVSGPQAAVGGSGSEGRFGAAVDTEAPVTKHVDQDSASCSAVDYNLDVAVSGRGKAKCDDPEGSACGRQTGIDELAGVQVEVEAASMGKDTKAKLPSGLGRRTRVEDMHEEEKLWRYVGSGIWAKTFVSARSFVTTSKGGPDMSKIGMRTARDVRTGKLLDRCRPDDVRDAELHRRMPEPTTIRAELQLEEAPNLFRQTGVDVAEVFSPPRVAHDAGIKKFLGISLRPGWSLDLTVCDPETGEPWDLSKSWMQKKARELVTSGRPHTIICSPVCTPFSTLQGLSRARADPVKAAAALEAGKKHIAFCVEMCKFHMTCGRYFVLEQPSEATPWKLPVLEGLVGTHGVCLTKFDVCMYGMTLGELPAKKPTRIATHSSEIARRLQRRCGDHLPGEAPPP